MTWKQAVEFCSLALLVTAALTLSARVSAGENSIVTTMPPAPASGDTRDQEQKGDPAKPPKAIKAPAATAPAETAAKTPDSKAAAKRTTQTIAALVNDEPITAYEIEQRQRFLSLSADLQEDMKKSFNSLIKTPAVTDQLKQILKQTIDANKGKSKDEVIAIFEERKKEFARKLQQQAADSARAKLLPGLRKQALEELIDEHLKLQEAKRLNAVADDEEVERIVAGMAERNKMTVEKFAAHMQSVGTNIGTIRARFKAELSWREVVRRRFGHLIAITEREVDRFVASAPGAGEDDAALQVQRITLKIPSKLDQNLIAKRVAEAEALASKLSGCTNAEALAAGIPDTKHEDLGTKKASSIPEPTRSLLMSARDGEVLPPNVAQGGVELWVLCGRTVVSGDEKKRELAQAELRQKEFEVLAKKHLKDLRLDAAIEYR